VRPGTTRDRAAIYPVVFPLVPEGKLLGRINGIHRRLLAARVVAARCKGEQQTRIFALGDDNRIIAEHESGAAELVALPPDRFVRFIVPTPGSKPPPPPRFLLALSAANRDARAQITIPHPAVRRRLLQVPENTRALGSGKDVPLPLELRGLMEGAAVEGSISAPGHLSHTFKKTIESPHRLRRFGFRGLRFEDGDRWQLHFFLVPRRPDR
jgi:hypothetical protein